MLWFNHRVLLIPDDAWYHIQVSPLLGSDIMPLLTVTPITHPDSCWVPVNAYYGYIQMSQKFLGLPMMVWARKFLWPLSTCNMEMEGFLVWRKLESITPCIVTEMKNCSLYSSSQIQINRTTTQSWFRILILGQLNKPQFVILFKMYA